MGKCKRQPKVERPKVKLVRHWHVANHMLHDGVHYCGNQLCCWGDGLIPLALRNNAKA